MTIEKIIVSGFGGQGVMGIGQLLTYAGMFDNKEVSWLPSYGPEMRGGAANCSVIISDDPIGAPNISSADHVIVMNEPSLDKFESYVKPGGHLFINSSLIKKPASRDDIHVHYFPVNELVAEFGNPRALNMIMVGGFNEVSETVTKESLEKAVEALYGKKKPEMLETNYKAMKFGGEKMMEASNV
ncbi:MAG: 2-oxoacid:acceptor oxidoreductase family protein [Tissierellia bacterium]|nr:2-oxoacid:acceptor oxidoreductase family protein [Tissierellia bacterium]